MTTKRPNRVILDNFDYWNYLQRAIGYSMPIPPELPRNPVDDELVAMAAKVDYLVSLYESERRNRGEGWQQPIGIIE